MRIARAHKLPCEKCFALVLNGHVTSYIKENFTWIHIRGSRLINHCCYAVEQEEKPHEKQYALCSLLYCGQKRFNMRQSLGSLFPKIIFKHKINHKKSIIWCKCRNMKTVTFWTILPTLYRCAHLHNAIIKSKYIC